MATGTACARAGIAGNPSDLFGGAVFAVPLPQLAASVTVTDTVAGAPPPERDGDELFTAATATLSSWAHGRGLPIPDDDRLAFTWETSIPRSVGLAGSSALIVAALRAVAQRWRITLDPLVLAALALAAERDQLGMPAGWQDRVVQALEAPVLVDCATLSPRDGVDVPAVRVLEPVSAVPLFVAWDERAGDSSALLHAPLRDRHARGDRGLVRAVDALSAHAQRAADAYATGDGRRLADAVTATATLRSGLGATTPRTQELIDVAGASGGQATSAGSGGSIAGVVVDPERLPIVMAALREAGCAVLLVHE